MFSACPVRHAATVMSRSVRCASLPEIEVNDARNWCPQFLASLTSISGNEAHLTDLDITVAACLTGQALNITYAPIAVKGVPALERHRIGLSLIHISEPTRRTPTS